MVRLPRELEEKRQRLARAARRAAFDSYIRRGRVPNAYSRITKMLSEAKNLDDGVALPTPAVSRLPIGRPTTHYTWRTAGDHKVRNAHAALHGRVFSWANPLEHGHPGTEPNCRCWPEPYYGDPAVPDAMLALVRQRQVDAGSKELWASIETATRPDGRRRNFVRSCRRCKRGQTKRPHFTSRSDQFLARKFSALVCILGSKTLRRRLDHRI